MRRLAAGILILLVGTAAFAGGAGADNSRTYEIEMFNAFGIVEGSDVRVAGVNVGTVSDLTINEKKRAVVTVDVAGELAEFGDETTCSSEPQSLIAEYFIDCEPKGDPLPDGGMVPAEQVQQTVQADLVQNTVREPYMTRFALILNEFGTALAGNPETLNEAIRLGAPALTEFERALAILDQQRNMIRDLNVDSNKIMEELAEQRGEVVRFIEEAGETAEISVSRREDLSRQFEILDDFLAELDPTLASLEDLAVEQTPLLRDLGAAAPALNNLALNLPPFNRASEPALETLGEAAVVGRRAMDSGRKPIRLLAKALKRAPSTTEMLADLLSDLDDPRRAVEIDERAGEATGRTSTQPGRKNTMGYTGLEGLLNYPYYQALATNQFDQVGHLLNFGLYGVNSGPCGSFMSGHDPDTGEPGVPAADGGTTTDILKADRCVAWLGPNQPGISEDLNLPPYDPSVCEDGTSPERAAQELCTPDGSTRRTGSDNALDKMLDRQLDGLRPDIGDASPQQPDDEPGAGPNESAPDVPKPGAGLDDLGGLGDVGNLDGLGGLGKLGNRKGSGMPALDLLDFLMADA